MKTITLELDDDTIARMDRCGASGSIYGQGAEILAMDILDAYQKMRASQKVDVVIPSHITFVWLNAWAKNHGMQVNKRGPGVEYWHNSDHSATGYSPTLAEAFEDMQGMVSDARGAAAVNEGFQKGIDRAFAER